MGCSAWLTVALGLAGPTGTESGAELVANAGQWPSHVEYATMDGGFWLDARGLRTQARTDRADDGPAGWSVALRFPGAGGDGWSAEGPTTTQRHWFAGDDPRAWVRDVPSFRAARWADLHPGIDLVVRCVGSHPRYELELQPGADPADVVVEVVGARGLSLDAGGRLHVETPLGELVQSPPLAFRGDGSERAVRFALLDSRHFTFVTDGDAHSRAWTIDPVLVWSGFLGGSIEEEIFALDRLAGGELVVAGQLISCDFPVTPGAVQPFFGGGFADGFVSRLSADGSTLLSSTYIGGDDLDVLKGVAVGPGDTITVTGETRSTDFPRVGTLGGRHAGALDLFVLRLTPAADTIVWSGLLGGFFDDRGNAIAVGADGSATIVGASNGFFPTTSGVVQRSFAGGQFSGDAVALRVLPDGSDVDWATYLGSFGDDVATAVAVDASGVATIVGQAGASTFPVKFGSFDTSFNGDRDGFVARLDAQGKQLVWGGFVGGSDDDTITALSVDATGAVGVAGSTDSSNLVVTPGAAQGSLAGDRDAFVAKISADGATLEWATYLGGERDDAALGIRSEPGGRWVAVGETLSAGFPTSSGAYDASFDGTPLDVLRDAFVTRVEPDGSAFEYSSYLGGAQDDRARAVDVLAPDEILIAGRTSSPDYPRTGGAYQPAFNIGSQGMGFVTRLNLYVQPVEHGAGKVSSLGFPPRIRWLGFPSLTDDDLLIGLDTALPFQPSVTFEGLAIAALPWLGGTLHVQPPLRRIGTFRNDFIGYGAAAVPITPDMVGTTRYYQVWTADPSDPFGAVMTPGLTVRFYP